MKALFRCKENPFMTVDYAAVIGAVYSQDIPYQRYYSESGTPVTIEAHKEAAYSFDTETGKGKSPFQFVEGRLTLTDEKEIEAFRVWVSHGHENIEEIEAV